MAFPRIRWLAPALLSSMAAAQIAPSNTSSSQPFGTFQLMSTSSMSTSSMSIIADLVALTETASNLNMPPPGLNGNLFLTTPENYNNLSIGDIAYISCDLTDYKGNIHATDLLSQASNVKATASILYSVTSAYCSTGATGPSLLGQTLVYSMTNSTQSAKILDDLTPPVASQRYFITIVSNTTGGNDTNGNNNNNTNPLGPSPSTAVAMIILYSITGIITALFLVIIITGAVRAHRNPERYGPRDLMGRPRQSRARGLARAMLDTLPIVKFGEREPAKPADVELASTDETREATSAVASAPETTHPSSSQPLDEISDTPKASQTHQKSGDQNGISAAEAVPTAAVGAEQDSSSDEGLGCSICTDDFEKGQDIRVLPCNHKFHPACVDPWLLNVSGTCPLCRIDLRPRASIETNAEGQHSDSPDTLAPPLDPETDHSHRRRSALREMLTLRSRPNATTEERLAALRRLRDERRLAENAAGNSSTNPNADETMDASRRKRISARLQEVFSVRTRRGTDAVVEGEASRSSGNVSSPAVVPEASASNATPPERSEDLRDNIETPGRSGDAAR